MPSKTLKVKDFMTKYVFTVSPDVTVHSWWVYSLPIRSVLFR